MSETRIPERKSVHQLAFDHYLRTGERLTNGEWLALYERKFNPYHDEIGRFTSPPGVTVSYGARGRPASGAVHPRGRGGNPSARIDPHSAASQRPAAAKPVSDSTTSQPSGFRSKLVREAVAPDTNHAETFFELNKRQAYLNRLRQEAGPKPAANVSADLDDFQKRLDADRDRLQARVKIIDHETNEILRAGLAPFDVGIATINIASGKGEARDYFSAASAVPGIGAGKFLLAGIARRNGVVIAEGAAREFVQMGGAYGVVRKLRGYHAHHIPAKSVSPFSKNEGPSIAMLAEDHRLTLSYGSGAKNVAHRQAQADLIAKGEFRKAQQMDIDDIRARFGNKYDDAIEQMLEYGRRIGR